MFIKKETTACRNKQKKKGKEKRKRKADNHPTRTLCYITDDEIEENHWRSGKISRNAKFIRAES